MIEGHLTRNGYTSKDVLYVPLLRALCFTGDANKHTVYDKVRDIFQFTEKDLQLDKSGYPHYHLDMDRMVGRLRRAKLIQPHTNDGMLRTTQTGRIMVGYMS
jgi:hypothetical protein